MPTAYDRQRRLPRETGQKHLHAHRVDERLASEAVASIGVSLKANVVASPRAAARLQEQRQDKLLEMYKSASETIVGKIGLNATVKKHRKFQHFLKAGASTHLWKTHRYSAKCTDLQRKTTVGKNVGKNTNANVGKQSTGHTSKKNRRKAIGKIMRQNYISDEFWVHAGIYIICSDPESSENLGAVLVG